MVPEGWVCDECGETRHGRGGLLGFIQQASPEFPIGPDQRLAIAALESALETKQSICVVTPPRFGKTSLCRLLADFAAKNGDVVHVSHSTSMAIASQITSRQPRFERSDNISFVTLGSTIVGHSFKAMIADEPGAVSQRISTMENVVKWIGDSSSAIDGPVIIMTSDTNGARFVEHLRRQCGDEFVYLRLR